MARRRRSSYRPTRRRSYSSARRSYSSRGRARSSSRRRGVGQTLRLVLQQPQQPRSPYGSFTPTSMFGAGLLPPGFQSPGYVGQGAPHPAQGGPGVPGARMVIRDPGSVLRGSEPQQSQFQPPPGYRLVPEGEN